MKLTKEQIAWLMSLVNEYDAVSHPLALKTYVELAKAHNMMCDCGETRQPCGNHVEIDPANPCEDCAALVSA